MRPPASSFVARARSEQSDARGHRTTAHAMATPEPGAKPPTAMKVRRRAAPRLEIRPRAERPPPPRRRSPRHHHPLRPRRPRPKCRRRASARSSSRGTRNSRRERCAARRVTQTPPPPPLPLPLARRSPRSRPPTRRPSSRPFPRGAELLRLQGEGPGGVGQPHLAKQAPAHGPPGATTDEPPPSPSARAPLGALTLPPFPPLVRFDPLPFVDRRISQRRRRPRIGSSASWTSSRCTRSRSATR